VRALAALLAAVMMVKRLVSLRHYGAPGHRCGRTGLCHVQFHSLIFTHGKIPVVQFFLVHSTCNIYFFGNPISTKYINESVS
jgi:hypothetical protein